MKKLKPKQKRHQATRARTELRKKGREGKGRSYYGSGGVSSSQPVQLKFIDLKTPTVFRLRHDSCEDVIGFINRVKRIGGGGNHINIVMDDITDIGVGAISMLLSVMQELVNKGIAFTGSKPSDPKMRAILEKSGFFKFVKGKVDDSNRTTKNTILHTGDNTTSQADLAEEIVNSMETVWGQRGRSPSIYSTVFEMMRNACDHAFRKDSQVKWHFALSHSDEQNLVKFSFVDNGKGIVRTFSEGLLKRFLNLFTDHVDIVETAFRDGIKSRTGLSWRGKGLPTIFENYQDGYIKNLVVISNDVYLDLDRGIRHTLTNSFSGTYYYWIVDQSCVKECFSLKK